MSRVPQNVVTNCPKKGSNGPHLCTDRSAKFITLFNSTFENSNIVPMIDPEMLLFQTDAVISQYPNNQMAAVENFIQIINFLPEGVIRTDLPLNEYVELIGHWITICYRHGKLYIYDSNLCGRTTDRDDAKQLFRLLFGAHAQLEHKLVTQQKDGISCGYFATAFAISLALGINPATIDFIDQHVELIHHFKNMIQSNSLVMYPLKNSLNLIANDVQHNNCTSKESASRNNTLKCSMSLPVTRASQVNSDLITVHSTIGLNTNDKPVCNNRTKKRKSLSVDAQNKRMKLFITPNLVDEIIDPKQLLKDKHIDAYIMIAQNQGFSLQDTHLISKVLTKNSTYKPVTTEGHVQILFREPTDNDEGIGHWLCCYYAQNKVYIYDSFYDDLDTKCLKAITILYPDATEINFMRVVRQTGAIDCGVYAMVFATILLQGLKPENLIIPEVAYLRQYIKSCFDSMKLLPFPNKPRLPPATSLNLRAV